MPLGTGLRKSVRSAWLAYRASYGRIRKFRRDHRKWPNLLRPQTFNEKILYRSIFDRRPLLHVLSDKLAVRTYVSERVGDTIAVPKVLFATRAPADLLSASLPGCFVMKSNHGQGQSYIHSRADIEIDRRRLTALASAWLAYDNYEQRGQWCYKDIEKAIFIEEHLSAGGPPPDDYKFFCFDGIPRLIEVSTDRISSLRRAYYDPDWRRLEFEFADPPILYDTPRPSNIEVMLSVVRKLSAGLDFIRVDLYDLGDKVVFGEMTCLPQNGRGCFKPRSWDHRLGAYWVLAKSA